MPRPAAPILSALLAMLLVVSAARADNVEIGGAGQAQAPSEVVFSSDRVIVEWSEGASHADRVEARGEADVSFRRDLGNRGFQLVDVEPGQTISEAIEILEADTAVAVAERDGSNALHATPSDPLFSQLWGLRNDGIGINGFSGAVAGADIDVDGAWASTVGTPLTTIAILDSGYRFDDPDLGPVAWTNPGETAGNGIDDDGNGFADDVHGYDFVGANASNPTSDSNPSDDNIITGGHGIHTAGTAGAAGDNAAGITGVAQNARIMALRICADQLVSDSSGTRHEARCPFSSQIGAINYAGNMGARVANMSLGGTAFMASVRDAIASHPGTLYVISAGNDGEDNDDEPHYPCNYSPLAEGKSAIDNVICVAATDQADGLASFSDWGATSVDLGAPGTETLSTYPAREARFEDNFETDDFSVKWTATVGADGGFSRTNESPLTSFGMSDSPGVATPVANTVRSSTSSGVVIPADYGSCVLRQRRNLSVGNGDTFQYYVLSNGSPVFSSGSVNASGVISTAPIVGLAGTTVQIRNTFTAGSTPVAGHGAWIDDVDFVCYKPPSAPLAYEFLNGTSMAAPHVTGAAALLFSLRPSASVTAVRKALLAGVDPDPALSGKTTTGGRLNVARAMESLVKSEVVGGGEIVVDELPPGTVSDTEAAIKAASPAANVRSRAKAACTVPKLAGKTLGQTTSALRTAGCTLGKVTKPKAKRGHKLPPLVVKSSTPAAGAKPASGKVDLTLGPKPKPRKHRH